MRGIISYSDKCKTGIRPKKQSLRAAFLENEPHKVGRARQRMMVMSRVRSVQQESHSMRQRMLNQDSRRRLIRSRYGLDDAIPRGCVGRFFWGPSIFEHVGCGIDPRFIGERPFWVHMKIGNGAARYR